MKDCDELLNKLSKCYFRGSLKFLLQPQDIEMMTVDWQQTFLDTTVNCERLKKHPLSCTYSKLFFKKLMSYLQNQEIHDEIYTHLCKFMFEEGSEDNFSYRHYVIGHSLDEIITIKETNKMVVNGTTGMRTWEAALMLADWALINKGIFCKKHILELGSGVGFTGVTIAKHCTLQSIYLTDCHSGVLNTICENIKINFPGIQEEDNNDEIVFKCKETLIGAMILDWNAVESLSTKIIPDILIGADIVYDPVIIQPLCDVLKSFFDRNKQLVVYIASVIRNEETFGAFLNSLRAMNFTYTKLPLDKNVFIEWDETIERCLLQIKC